MQKTALRKWDVFLADLNPSRGTEPGKVRPVVIVQTDLLNGFHPSTIVCPISSQVQADSKILRVHLKSKEAGLDHESDILVDQLRAIDNKRLIRRLGRLSPKTGQRLHENILTLLT